jgi:enoyl-CoA hydratase
MTATHSTTDAATGLRLWRSGAAAWLQLDRPEKSNAYTQSMLNELLVAVDEADEDPAVRVVVLTGRGARAFCAGADRRELTQRTVEDVLNLKSARVFQRLADCRKVTLAAINGGAIAGGLELALACDIRVAVRTATFALPEPELGLIPAAGGTFRLAEVVGLAAAREVILGGAVWTADEAWRRGLLSAVTEDDGLHDEVEQWVQRAARRDPVAVMLAKRALRATAPHDEACRQLEAASQAVLHLRRQSEATSAESQRSADRTESGSLG